MTIGMTPFLPFLTDLSIYTSSLLLQYFHSSQSPMTSILLIVSMKNDRHIKASSLLFTL
jgi:hypothetical protein